MAEEGDPNPLAVLSPPHWVINDDDHGGYVIIATWTMMCYMILTVLVRVTRKITILNWGLDDYLISAATVCSLIQSGILHHAVAFGLGKRQANLLPDQLDLVNKYTYAYQILFVVVICLSKISLLQFTGKLIPNPRLVLVVHTFTGLLVAWGVATVFGLAFQCALPKPWNITNGVCKNLGALYYSVGIIDLISDLAITIVPLATLANVQMQSSKKVTVMGVFFVRLSTCAVEGVRLYYLTGYLDSSDRIFDIVDLAIWTQAVANISIITACIPCLKPFLSSMRSGVFNTALPAGFEGGLTYTLDSSQQEGSGTHASGKGLYGSKKQATSSTIVESGKVLKRSESKTRLTEDDRIYKTTEFTIDSSEQARPKGRAF